MSLVTLEINDVADVIDEAITRHVLVSHNDNKASKLFSDLLSFKSDLQELKTRINEDNRFDEVKSYIEARISTLELNLSSLKDIVEKYKEIDSKFKDYTLSDRFTKELAYLREDVDREKRNVNDLVLKRVDELRESIVPLVRDEISRIPLPEDGEPGEPGDSVTLDDVLPFISKEIEERIAVLPTPKDGEPGIDGTSVDFDEVKSFIINEIDKIPLPQDGKDGTSIDLDTVHLLIKKEIGKEIDNISIPIPKDGQSITVEDVVPFIKEEIEKSVANLPHPKDGEPGIDGVDGISVDLDVVRSIILEEVAKIPPPLDGKDGTDVDLDDLRAFIENEVAKIPLPKDGKSFTVDDVSNFINDLVERKFASLSIPSSGIDGKDGVGIAGAIIDRDGNLIVTCTNGLTIPLGNVVGKDGKDVESSQLDLVRSRLDNVAKNIELLNVLFSRIETLENQTARIETFAEDQSIHDRIESVERQVCDLISNTILDKSNITKTLDELKEHISELDKVDLDLSNKITSQLDYTLNNELSTALEGFSSRISDLETRPIPRDGKDAEINIEELRSIYVEDIEARLKNVYKVEHIDTRFENVYNEIQSKIDVVKNYIVERIKSLPQLPDTELIIKNNLMNVPTISEVRQIFDDEFGKVKNSFLELGGKEIQPIQIQQEEIPEDIAEKVAKAISIVAESPTIYTQTQQQPIVVNVTNPPSSSSSKKIVLRRDKDGNTVADVTNE